LHASFIVAIIILSGPAAYQNVSGNSPSFVRQEILDDDHDRIFNVYQKEEANLGLPRGFAFKEDDCPNRIECSKRIEASLYDGLTDILAVNYFSNGKILNATVWLRDDITNVESLRNITRLTYGMLIDSDANPQTGSDGIDHSVDIQWVSPPVSVPSQSVWLKLIAEWTTIKNATRNNAQV